MSVEAMLAVQHLTIKTSHASFRVLMCLAHYADASGGNSWPSVDTISDITQSDEKTVRRCLAALREVGLIVGNVGGGRGKTTIWALTFMLKRGEKEGTTPPFSPGKEGMVPGLPGIAPPFSKKKEGIAPPFKRLSGLKNNSKGGVVPGSPGIVPYEIVSKKESKKESSSLRSPCARRTHARDKSRNASFDIFWKQYPRKVGRGQAEKAYRQAMTRGATDEALLEGLTRQRWADDPRFIPHASTWLNGDRWLDDPQAAAPVVVKIAKPSREERIMRAAGLWPDDEPGVITIDQPMLKWGLMQ